MKAISSYFTVIILFVSFQVVQAQSDFEIELSEGFVFYNVFGNPKQDANFLVG